MSVYEIVSCLFSIINLISIVLMYFQLKALKVQEEAHNKQEKEHHEEVRRENTVRIITEWNNSLKKESRLAEKIVEKLDRDQCIALYNYRDLTVDENSFRSICQLCSELSDNCQKCQCTGTNNQYHIHNIPETELRGYVTSYLNSLEIVALSWQQGIVDRAMLEQQFSYLYDNTRSKSALETYRSIAGNGNSYPVLNSFYNKIKQNASTTVKNKNTQ